MNRRSAQEKYVQLRIQIKAAEQSKAKAAKAEDHDTFYDCVRLISRLQREVQEVLKHV